MPLHPQAVPVNFSRGLDTKTDAYQVQLGNFLVLNNAIFTKGGLLQKRNGFKQLTPFPTIGYTTVTTLNGNLTALGSSVAAFNPATDNWVSTGSYTPLQLNTLPLVRNSLNQTQADSVVSPNGQVCTVYTEQVSSGSFRYLYVIANAETGQVVVEPTLIPAASGGTITGSPRVFMLQSYFVIVFTNEVSATYHLQYICIPSTNPSAATLPADIADAYQPASTVAWDGVVYEQNLFIAYNTTSPSQEIAVTYLSASAAIIGGPPATPAQIIGAADDATMMSLCVDASTGWVYIAFYNASASYYYVAAVDDNLILKLAPQAITTNSTTLLNLATTAQNGVCTVVAEVENTYSYGSPQAETNYLTKVNVTMSSTGTPSAMVRSVGLASKAFLMNNDMYVLATYSSPFQPTYFLINATLSTEANPIVVAKLAYENGGGYLATGLPNVTITGDIAQIAYLYKDLVQALSVQNNSQQLTTGGVYAQTGANLVTFTFTDQNIASAEIAQNLQLGGGFLWNYDGYLPVENNFFLYPDNVLAVGSGTSGSMSAQQYYYQVTYEWSDNKGNIYRSAPSIPATITLTSDTSVLLNIPTLRLTYKIANQLKIVIYRWSVQQPNYYQVTSITSPTLNNPSVDSISYTDTQSDAEILGNNLIYTTGGVLEDISAPATNIMTLFDTRLWMVDAEDPNLLWYSKQVIENVPVEMSDLLTYYVAPTTGAQGSTGPITALAPMDDKLIVFKEDALYYINGSGPDNTGSNSQYSPAAVFISGAVGCTNSESIVLTPSGLMFQTDKGIWLLGRDLSTSYIGAPVEAFNSYDVTSANVIPGTNQVRFGLNTNVILMYDYYYQQWGTFNTPQATSSTLYEGMHTLLSTTGLVYQESAGQYLDGSTPVTLNFQTSWIQLTGLQGFQRAYEVYILGTYITPHKLNVQVAYDYNNSPTQNDLIVPDNYAGNWGSQAAWGTGGNWGGPGSLEQWRVFFQQERCQVVSLIVNEVYDSSFGVPAGEGLTLSGMNFVIGVNKAWPMLAPSRQVG